MDDSNTTSEMTLDTLLIEDFLNLDNESPQSRASDILSWGPIAVYPMYLSLCAEAIVDRNPSWNHVASDPRYQAKLTYILLTIFRVHALDQGRGKRSLVPDECEEDTGFDIPLHRAAYSPNLALLLRVLQRCITSNQPSCAEGTKRHKYCDESCKKARHVFLVEQIERSWKDRGEDLKRHGPRSISVIKLPPIVLVYIFQFVKFVTLFHDFMKMLAFYHIVSNLDMVVYDLTRHLVPITTFILISWTYFGYILVPNPL
ncbi:hypothetical protein BJ165DRAFT_1409576 [Panaeolus papilionaceus]|nr:hypothetical protein BJ165DRAFT_1409576 [Panaeolus papilionaceus]